MLKCSPTRLPLHDLRAEFAVAHAGADLHFWPDCCDCPDDFSALVRRDAVPALRCRGCYVQGSSASAAAGSLRCFKIASRLNSPTTSTLRKSDSAEPCSPRH